MVLIHAETNILQLWKKFEFFREKGDPWGDLNAPEATSDSNFLSFLSDLLKDSEHLRITNAQNHFNSTFGSAYLISKKMKIKLAKQAKKEPRKASFPWDIGFLYVQPMKYTLIFQNINFITAKGNLMHAIYEFPLNFHEKGRFPYS